jgi:transcriptional regulator with PAS, ATPase and Fis domain
LPLPLWGWGYKWGSLQQVPRQTECTSKRALQLFVSLMLLPFEATQLALELLREKETETTSTLFNMPIDLDREVLMYERELIRQALAKVEGGSVVDAAKWLGISYQLLTHRIKKKHPELIKERSPVFRRPSRKTERRRK